MPLRVASAMSLRSSSPDLGANNSASTAPMPAPTRKNVSRVEILSPESRSCPIEISFRLEANPCKDLPVFLKLSRMMTARDYSKGPLMCARKVAVGGSDGRRFSQGSTSPGTILNKGVPVDCSDLQARETSADRDVAEPHSKPVRYRSAILHRYPRKP